MLSFCSRIVSSHTHLVNVMFIDLTFQKRAKLFATDRSIPSPVYSGVMLTGSSRQFQSNGTMNLERNEYEGDWQGRELRGEGEGSLQSALSLPWNCGRTKSIQKKKKDIKPGPYRLAQHQDCTQQHLIFERKNEMALWLSEKCPPQAPIFKHSVPSCWCCMRIHGTFRRRGLSGGHMSLRMGFESLWPCPDSGLHFLLCVCGWRYDLSVSCPGPYACRLLTCLPTSMYSPLS
jgi:hypothetical protein